MTDVEVVADATEWLAMKYKDKKQDSFEIHFHDDEEQPETRKRKMPTRVSVYEVAKKSIISKLAKV
jgi:transcription elongation factor SPT6